MDKASTLLDLRLCAYTTCKFWLPERFRPNTDVHVVSDGQLRSVWKRDEGGFSYTIITTAAVVPTESSSILVQTQHLPES